MMMVEQEEYFYEIGADVNDEEVYYPIDEIEFRNIESKTASSGIETTVVIVNTSNTSDQIEFEGNDVARFSDVRYLFTEQELATVRKVAFEVDNPTILKILSALFILIVVFAFRNFLKKLIIRPKKNEDNEEISVDDQTKHSSITTFLESDRVINNLEDVEKFSQSLFHLSAILDIDLREYDNMIEIISKIENRFIAPLRFLEEHPQSDIDFEISCFHFCGKLLFSWERVRNSRLNIEGLQGNCEMQRYLHNLQRSIDASDMVGMIETVALLKECGRGEDVLVEAAEAKIKGMHEEEDRAEDARILRYWEQRMSSAAQAAQRMVSSPLLVEQSEPNTPILEIENESYRIDLDTANMDSSANGSLVLQSQTAVSSFNGDGNISSSLSNQMMVMMYANIQRVESAADDVERERRNRRQQRMERENHATSIARDTARKIERENDHRKERIRKARDDLQSEVLKRKDRIAGRIEERKRKRLRMKEHLLWTDRWILRAAAVAVAAAIAEGIRGHSLHTLRIKSLMDLSLSVARSISAALSQPAVDRLQEILAASGDSSSTLSSLFSWPLSLLPSSVFFGWPSLGGLDGLTAWSAAAGAFAFGGDAVLWLMVFLWIERAAPSVAATFLLNNLGVSRPAAQLAGWIVFAVCFWEFVQRMFLDSLLWLLMLYLAHIVFVELLCWLDCREEAPLQWKRTRDGAEHVVLREDGSLFSPALNARDLRRPTIILLHSFFLLAAYFATHFFFV